MIEKCKWHSNSKTSCSLMIDDIVPVAISNSEYVGPENDWGYLKDSEKSLYTYLKQYLFDKYPEIRGTVFLPIQEQNNILANGYQVFKSENNAEYFSFLGKLKNQFEFAFHGIDHHIFIDGNLVHEFTNHDKKNDSTYKELIEKFLNESELTFQGGKFPGYKYNDNAIDFIQSMGIKWIALHAKGANKKLSDKNELNYISDRKLVNVPTNITGDIFNTRVKKEKKYKKLIKSILYPSRIRNFENLLKDYYHNGFPIIIQEHWQNLHTNGKRQTPNLFDDINSLERIYSLLRGEDVWHATCSQIAHYFDSFNNTEVKVTNEEIHIQYKGLWEEMNLSFRSKFQQFKNIETGDVYQGFLKNGEWIFNNLTEGSYIRI
jgi:hypothetical protein